MELSMIGLDPHVIPHFDANELPYVFVFYTGGFDSHTSCDCRLNRSPISQ